MSLAPPPKWRIEAAHLWRKLTGRRAHAQRTAKRAFHDVLQGLTDRDIAIDLGANVGEFTVPMARTGAQVYAFEPDPHALTLLKEATKDHPNVTIIPAAAGTKDGTTQLYRASDFARNPDRRTKSSSLFSDKRNISEDAAIEIDIKDFPAFLQALDRDIALIKIDIEGAEVPLMERLLQAPVAARIGHIFVETHERKLHSLAARTAALKAQTKGRMRPAVNWDWH